MSGSSAWNTEPLSFSPNTNVMDEQTMPSKEAAAAREKAAEVMAAVKKGDYAEAEKLMGSQKESGAKGILPMGYFKEKMGFGKKKKGEDGEGEVVKGKKGEGEVIR